MVRSFLFVKKIIVTDTHLGYKKANDYYHGVVSMLFQRITEYAEDNNIRELIHLGDFFDNRKHLSLKTIHTGLKIGDRLNQKFDKSYLVVGNHDLFYKDQIIPNSLEIFNKFENIEVVDEPMEHDNILLMPWIIDEAQAKSTIKDSNTEYCMGHFEINGAIINVSGKISEGSRFGFSDFSEYKRVLSGHYHTKGNYSSNVEYIGAPYHMDFNDSGLRGFYVWDDGDMEFIEFDEYPKFISYTARYDDVLSPNEFTNQIVRIVFREDFGTVKNTEIVERISAMSPHQLFVKYSFDKEFTNDQVDEELKLQGPREVHKNYIVNSDKPNHINPDMLNRLVDSLYDELENGENK